ncbi:hypothetical protein [Bacillus chungangensis]|uniref:Uncharacterized protein n=1 Tax=Bacillus chungangensis TaxID=587633 RepID=A0ABT9WMK5_9BACI|nr:hypothetical protein [Bacillus chungangensis]MDQ0174436.1 hypothetical protein [Bacillus chungangensis]
MAKLYDVKVLDMVDGEVKKIEYDGHVYVKTSAPAQVGDVMLEVRGTSTRTADAFYKVEKLDDYVRVSDDRNGLHGWVKEQQGDYFYIFRKVGDSQFRKIDRKPAVGDYVKFNEDCWDASAGVYYEIIGIDEDGDLEFIDDVGDENIAMFEHDDFEVFEKVVDKPNKPKFKVGDYIVPLPETNGRYRITNTEMKLGVVKRIMSNKRIEVEVLNHENKREKGYTAYVEERYFRHATEEEIFNPGTKVRLNIPEGKRPRYGWGYVENGVIGEVRRVVVGRLGEKKIVVDFPCNGKWYGDPSELVIVNDDVEIPKYEVGDIVRIVGIHHGRKGMIGEVSWVDDHVSVLTKKPERVDEAEAVELIAKASDRFDIK